jgi:apolipoprotein N-acyltransferase
VPFGEYVPLERLLRGLIEFFDLPMSHAGSGPLQQPLLKAGRWRVATAICYEIVYADLVRRDAREADVIVTISNDSWFGRSIGPHQHLQMARMRALENGRYVLRATNNGITAIIAPSGAVAAEVPQFEAVVLDGAFSGMTGVTPYGTVGDVPVLALIAAGIGISLLRRRRRRA